MPRSKLFEARAEVAERLAQEVPALRQRYDELAKIWRTLARQAETLDEPTKDAV
jgi:hypothetical protein